MFAVYIASCCLGPKRSSVRLERVASHKISRHCPTQLNIWYSKQAIKLTKLYTYNYYYIVSPK
jgi:hypothetical protein